MTTLAIFAGSFGFATANLYVTNAPLQPATIAQAATSATATPSTASTTTTTLTSTVRTTTRAAVTVTKSS